MKEFFTKNRKKITDFIHSSRYALVLFSGVAPIKLGDQNHNFTPSRNFFYLTGLDREKFIFLLLKNGETVEETLFIERQDELKAKWDGKTLTSSECEKISGIKNIKYLDEFEATFASGIFKNDIKKVFLDLENRNFEDFSKANLFAQKIQKMYPQIKIKNSYSKFAKLRTLKEPNEIDQIKTAIKLTKDAIYNVMKNVKTNVYEYEIEAYFDFMLKKNGVKEKAFETIFASGENATILHYKENNSKIDEDDLILLDCGATFGYYSADITRTFPANKKFSQRQKTFYNIVLKGQEIAISNIKDGVTVAYLQDLVKQHYFDELSKLGLVQDKEDVDKYYYHRLGHQLGLETHDAAYPKYHCLKEGMVITIEPGLYIKEEKIGIRIEDDVLVTKNGCEVLSKDIIKTVEDIEKFMEEN